MSGVTDFAGAQRANRRNTWFLLAGLTLIAGFAGWLIGLPFTKDNLPVDKVLAAAMVLASIAFSIRALVSGDKLVLASAKAKPIKKEDAPLLFNVVEEMSIAASLPMPAIQVMEVQDLNAFTTGLSTSKATLVVTRGLLDALNREELQGVVAQQMAHIANYDTRYMTVVSATVGLIVLLTDRITGRFTETTNDTKDNWAMVAVWTVITVLVVFLAALVSGSAHAVQMAVSIQRAYLADATSVQFTRNPEGLIAALTKMGATAKPFPGASNATQHLFIVNPMQHRNAGEAGKILGTHPDIEDRITRLRNLGDV